MTTELIEAMRRAVLLLMESPQPIDDAIDCLRAAIRKAESSK